MVPVRFCSIKPATIIPPWAMTRSHRTAMAAITPLSATLHSSTMVSMELTIQQLVLERSPVTSAAASTLPSVFKRYLTALPVTTPQSANRRSPTTQAAQPIQPQGLLRFLRTQAAIKTRLMAPKRFLAILLALTTQLAVFWRWKITQPVTTIRGRVSRR